MTNRLFQIAALFLLAAGGMQAHAAAVPPATCPSIAIGPGTDLPAGTVGVAYSPVVFSASGSSSTPYMYEITSGLPADFGLVIDDSGNFSGIPTQAGDYLVTITATDTEGCSGGRTDALTIGIGSQTIDFTSTAPTNAMVGGATYSVAAAATSNLPVTLTIDASAMSICSISGSSVSFQSVGTCVIDANQAGNSNYAAAPQAQQTFAVGKGDQTITFTSTIPTNPTVNGPTYTVTATATSGLPVTFTIDATSATVCTIIGSTVSFIATGNCTIDADQAGDANWNPALQAQQMISVGKSAQTISFTSTAPTAAAVGGATYTPTATATSGLPVVLTIDASASSVCTISAGAVSFVAVGTCVIDANQGGDTNYNPAPQIQQSFAVGKGTQTISFTSTAPSATVGGPTYAVTATATSGLSVVLSIDAASSSICTIAGSIVSFTAAGTCVIDANQPGDANWNPALQSQQSVTVGKGAQTISFTSTAPSNAAVAGATYTVTATATSNLTVTFSIDASAASVCSISGSSVSFQTAGTCVIDANQAGDTNWNAAPLAQQSFGVAKGNQTINFTSTAPLNAQVALGSYTVTATATSGLSVTFSIDVSAASVCSVAGSTVSFIGAGTCVIDANQAGNANYNAAPLAQQSFIVSKQNQTISFTSTSPSAAKNGGATYLVTATATSSLTVTFSSATTSVCTVSGGTVTFVGAGTCTINADQAGNSTFNAAPEVQQSFLVAKGDQTITVTSNPPTFGSASASAAPHTYTITATASSGLVVTFTTSGACTNSSGTITFGPGAGTCSIFADQAGDTNWNPATQAQQSVAVEVPASATADSHAVTGNVAILVPANGVLTNDTGTAIVIRSYGKTTGSEQTAIGSSTPTAQAGSVTLNANGSYSYDPPANFTGTDSFKYIIGNDLAATSTGTVTLNVSDRIIVVSTGGSGNCKPVTPTPCSLTTADGAAATTGKDLVFVQSGSYGGAVFTMNTSQVIAGNAVSLAQAVADASITLAPDSVALATINAGTAPTLTNNAVILTLNTNDLVEYFNINPSGGSAIAANALGAGTDTIHDIGITATNAANGVNLTGNSTTFAFTNISATSNTGTAFLVSGGGGTVTMSGAANTLSSTGGTALNIANTTIGAGGVNFLSIASGSASNSAPNGIILDTTGSTAGLTVTGSGGAGSGGTIQHKTGADGSTSQGSGIYLNSTFKPSFSWMQLNDFQNFGIFGNSVNGLVLDHVVVNGTNGTSQGGLGEGDAYFSGLSGSPSNPATVSNSTFTGAIYDAFHVFNNGETLNRITITNSTFATISGAGNAANDALAFQATGGVFNATVQSSSISSARSDLFQLNLLGVVTSDLVFGGATVPLGNTLTNSNANIVSGGGGITIGGGGPTNNVTLTYNVSHNSIRGSHGAVLAIFKGTGVGASFTGTIDSNTIGQVGVAGSGSTQGDGIAVFQDGAGTSNTTITNNHVSGVVGGIQTLLHNGAAGQMSAVVQSNTVDTLDQVNGFSGLYLQTGSATGASGDNNKSCLTVGGAGALKNSVDIGANTGAAIVAGYTLEQEGVSRVGLLGTPNYSGTAYNFTAVQNYIAANNNFTGSNAQAVFAFGDPGQPAAGGYFGACPP